MNKDIFLDFNKLLNQKQKEIYQKIIKERIFIYNISLSIGILSGLIYYYKNKKEDFIVCKSLMTMSFVKLFLYKMAPKSPIMLYYLDTKEQTDAWANIYIEMKKRWKMSIILGFIGYSFIAYSFNNR